jgi:hypothetical protein
MPQYRIEYDMKMNRAGIQPMLDFLGKRDYDGAKFSFDLYNVSGVLEIDRDLTTSVLQIIERGPHATSFAKLPD